MYLLVVYDVSDDVKRQRLARVLEAWGLARIQRSAFVGRLSHARARDLARLVERIIDPETDVVHMVRLQDWEWRSAIVVGSPRWGPGRVEGVKLLR
ncbi:MAG: CRISPR-associated endonuclease Cas2 [Desulfurococcales archaeon]|nr:CRISPR-associated endonuclease Cas2 [Desulfurococcales archaeon]